MGAVHAVGTAILPTENVNFANSGAYKVLTCIPIIGVFSQFVECSLESTIESTFNTSKKLKLLEVKNHFGICAIVRDVVTLAAAIALFVCSVWGLVPLIVVGAIALTGIALNSYWVHKNRIAMQELNRKAASSFIISPQTQPLLMKSSGVSIGSASLTAVDNDSYRASSIFKTPSSQSAPVIPATMSQPSFAVLSTPPPAKNPTVPPPIKTKLSQSVPVLPVSKPDIADPPDQAQRPSKFTLPITGPASMFYTLPAQRSSVIQKRPPLAPPIETISLKQPFGKADTVVLSDKTGISPADFSDHAANYNKQGFGFYFAIIKNSDGSHTAFDGYSLLNTYAAKGEFLHPITKQTVNELSYYVIQDIKKPAEYFCRLEDLVDPKEGDIRKKFILATDSTRADIEEIRTQLGAVYEEGCSFVKKDSKSEAIFWYKKAAENNHYFANMRLAELTDDPNKKNTYLKKALKCGLEAYKVICAEPVNMTTTPLQTNGALSPTPKQIIEERLGWINSDLGHLAINANEKTEALEYFTNAHGLLKEPGLFEALIEDLPNDIKEEIRDIILNPARLPPSSQSQGHPT